MSDKISSEDLERFFSLSTDLLCLASVDGYFLKLNQAWEDTLGYKKEEMEGTPFINFVHPDDIEATINVIANLGNNQPVLNFVNRYRHKDGSYRFFEWRSQAALQGKIYAVARDITEQYLATKKIKESETILNRAQSTAKIGSWELNLQTFAQHWSDEHYRIFELEKTPPEKLYEAYRSKIHPDDIPELDRVVQDAIEKAKGFTYNHRVCCHDGSIKYVIGIGEVEKDEQGKPISLYGTVQDITERTLAEQEMMKVKEMLAETSVVARIGGWELNLITHKLFWSNITKEIHEIPLEYEPDLNTAINFYKEGESRQLVQDVISKGMTSSEPWDIEATIVTAKGREIWVKTVGKAEFKNGIYTRLYGTFQDIDERKKAEVALRESQNFAKSIIENIPLMVFVKNAQDFKFVELNKAGETLLGLKKEELLGKGNYDFFPKEEADFFTIKDREALNSGGLIDIEEEKIQTMHQGERLLHTHKIAITDVQGNPQYLLGISEDITEKKQNELIILQKNKDLLASEEELKRQAENLFWINEKLIEQKNMAEEALSSLQEAQNQLIQSEKMASLGLLTAGVAHEINNPINYIYGGIQGLEPVIDDILELLKLYNALEETSSEEEKASIRSEIASIKDGDTRMEYYACALIGSIKEGANRVASIVQSLRNFSRTDEGISQSSNLHDNINNTLLILHSKYKDRIKVVKHFDLSIHEIICFAGQLSQVFMNLIDNAIGAMGIEGTLTITTRNLGKSVEISIQDTGSGIPEGIREKIFDPFFTTKGVGNGTGLGLSIVHGIIKKHKGHIAVQSEIGVGTTFTITLPTSL